MAQGRPKKWVSVQLDESILLGKTGVRLVIWDKWGKTRRATAIVSVGGIRWYPYKAKKPCRITWDELDRWAR